MRVTNPEDFSDKVYQFVIYYQLLKLFYLGKVNIIDLINL